jgi:hypothetical protein
VLHTVFLSIPRLPRTGWLAACLALALAIFAVDAAVGQGVVLMPALVIVPVLAAAGLSARETGAFAVLALVLAAILGPPDGIAGDGQYFVRLAIVAGGGALSLLLAAVRERDEELRRRSAFLAEAAQALNSSLEPDVTLRNLAQLAVPTVCDWCIVDLLEAGGELRRVAATHDPDRVADKLGERIRPDLAADTPLTRALRTGEA